MGASTWKLQPVLERLASELHMTRTELRATASALDSAKPGEARIGP